MRLGRAVGRAQDRKRKAFHNILRYSERRSQGFFLLKKKSLLEARVLCMPNRPGNPAGLLELAMNRIRGIVSKPLAG